MRFILGLPTDDVHKREEFGTAIAILEMARAAEEAGFEAVYVTDHPRPPASFLASCGHHALEPTVALSFAAAATTRLRLMTNLYIVLYRNPFIAAKAIATLDSLSNGRVIMGTGAGYLKPEFKALGADFENRNDRLDEWLHAMKAVWSGKSVDLQGIDYEAHGHSALPTPVSQPHPPVWIGGNSKRAIRRAVEFGQGWIPMPAPKGLASFVHSAAIEGLHDLEERIQYARDHAQKIGRQEPFDITAGPFNSPSFDSDIFDAEAYVDEVATLMEMGITYIPLGFAHAGSGAIASRKDFLELTEAFGRDVIQTAKRIGS